MMKIKRIKKPLSLKNDGNLELVFLGAGSSFANTLYNTNFLLIKGDTHILVDFGVTGPIALPKVAGLQATDIEAFLPTHSHSDHIGGLEYLALANRYIGVMGMKKPKLKMIIVKQYERVLWDMSLRGGMRWNEINEEGKYLTLKNYFDIVTPKKIKNPGRDLWRLDYNGIKLEIFRTIHIPEQALAAGDAFLSYGLFVDDRLFISGDTKFDKPLIDFYKDRSEIMFHDGAITPNPVHACIDELRTLPKDVKKKMYLMDYSDSFKEVDISEFGGYAIQGNRYIFD